MKRAALASVMVLTLLATSVAEAAMEGPSGDKEPTAGGASAAPAAAKPAAAKPAPAPPQAAAPTATAAAVAAPTAAPPPAPPPPAPAPTPVVVTTTAATIAAPAATAPEGQPLNLKPPQPLNLAPESAGTPWYVKLFAFFGVAGLGAWFWRRHRARTSPDFGAAKLRILSRATVGARTELLVVDAGGTRVLLGVTAQTVSTLAVLPDEGDGSVAERADEEESEDERVSGEEPIKLPFDSFADRARALLGAPTPSELPPGAPAPTVTTPPPPPRRARPAPAPTRAQPAAVEGQARGLRAVLAKPRRP
ncbi:MAG: flagellar biosynthetic protein FliO [Myxococcales bacterium]|nr:flagellar biosynthetic protein FliO [Myxococcales bacterium]